MVKVLSIGLILTILIALGVVVTKAIRFRCMENQTFTSMSTAAMAASFYALFVLQTCLPIVNAMPQSSMGKIPMLDMWLSDKAVSIIVYSVFIIWLCCAALCRVLTGAMTIRPRYLVFLSVASLLLHATALTPPAVVSQANSLSTACLYFWCISAATIRIELLFRKSKEEKAKQLSGASSKVEKKSAEPRTVPDVKKRTEQVSNAAPVTE